MKALLLFIALSFLFISSAHSQLVEEVRCTGSNCLTSGAEYYDHFGNLNRLENCNNGDCDLFGFNALDLRVINLRTDAYCFNNSCYGEGYQEVIAATGDVMRTRTCYADSQGNSDCLANGWEDEFHLENRIDRVTCTDGTDCRNGFNIQRVENQASSLEGRIIELEDFIATKREEFKEYVKTYKQPNKEILDAIHEAKKELIDIKKTLKDTSGEVVVGNDIAVCLAPGQCFQFGYSIYANN